MEVVIDTTSLGLHPVTWAHPQLQLLLSHMPSLNVPNRPGFMKAPKEHLGSSTPSSFVIDKFD